MKLGVFADVHSRVDRLSACLNILADCDLKICAGDISDQSNFEPDAMRLIAEHQVLAIKGNHDYSACGNELIYRSITCAADAGWLEELCKLPATRYFTARGIRVGIFHGSPWDVPERDIFHYVFPEVTAHIERLASANCDLLILGHTHRPMHVATEDVVAINPGSCGFGNPPTCVAIDLPVVRAQFRTLP